MREHITRVAFDTHQDSITAAWLVPDPFCLFTRMPPAVTVWRTPSPAVMI